ncbi:nitrophenyl compound nitroreductase subunit ArsF family protein [Novipirellula artificiosorum]|uniref:Uncharacterized protein n=1 Tax=Novipirellula artificiosorum TaxID=2528016 RepID=A0A5C6DQS4_9BACT|nr:nitrophenyl compound nitroreductase subunit ArsF family protein [Novipirellula artificiosorum]TWU38207.1 hypothetical protein Poly41_26830 [Novipirellula artificiosorum]
MDLQKTLSICLISFFAATVVVLIARAFDSQAASRLEPQLTRIADELEAIRASGGFASIPVDGVDKVAVRDGLVVYYFYSNTRCTTCRAIEAQTEETVRSDFAEELRSGKVTWKTLNYEQDRNADLASQFEIIMPVVVLARFENGAMVDWSRLDQVWGLVSDKPAFAEMIRDAVNKMLSESQNSDSETAESETKESQDLDSIPLPDSNGIPLPTP